jgi:hypothetical protein
MMCIACEQDGMWLAYLRRKGLITPDGYLVEEPPSLFGPVEAPPASEEAAEKKDDSANKPTDDSSFSCDDPTAR